MARFLFSFRAGGNAVGRFRGVSDDTLQLMCDNPTSGADRFRRIAVVSEISAILS
jgi:hypothetical protein